MKDKAEDATLVVIGALLERVVKKTASAAVGKEAPAAPPSVADQFVVLFQFPVPPDTKYLSAIVVH